MPQTIEMEPLYVERVTPRRYVRVYQEDPDNIESVRIIAPRIGVKGFGLIEIRRKHPVYKMAGSLTVSKSAGAIKKSSKRKKKR